MSKLDEYLYGFGYLLLMSPAIILGIVLEIAGLILLGRLALALI